MEIEVVEFYPIHKKGSNIEGTLHIYLIDKRQDLRGIYVTKEKKKWRFEMPYRVQYDKETKKEQKFPVFCYTQPEEQQEFIDLIKSLGREYIEKNFLSNENIDNKSKES